jgi:hypothetical protein
MRRSEAGQSESWPKGQPDGRCGACGRASQARTREALGFRPGPLRGSATSVAGRGQAAARNRREPSTPEERTEVLRRCGGTSKGVAVCLCFSAIREISRGRYQGAPFGVPSPLNVEGRKLKAQLARRRGNAGVWLFEIVDRNRRLSRVTSAMQRIRVRACAASRRMAACTVPILLGSPLCRERLP